MFVGVSCVIICHLRHLCRYMSMGCRWGFWVSFHVRSMSTYVVVCKTYSNKQPKVLSLGWCWGGLFVSLFIALCRSLCRCGVLWGGVSFVVL